MTSCRCGHTCAAADVLYDLGQSQYICVFGLNNSQAQPPVRLKVKGHGVSAHLEAPSGTK